jgi:hypothetical protein
VEKTYRVSARMNADWGLQKKEQQCVDAFWISRFSDHQITQFPDVPIFDQLISFTIYTDDPYRRMDP